MNDFSKQRRDGANELGLIYRLAPLSFLFVILGCSRNAPGTMGGGGFGIPETVATGAPKLWAQSSPWTDSHMPSTLLEDSASSFEEEAGTNSRSLTLPEALRLRDERLSR